VLASPALDATVDASLDLARPRAALIDRIGYARADAASLQRTVGNQMAKRIAVEQRATGDAAPNDSAPKLVVPGKKPMLGAAQSADDPVAPAAIERPPPPPPTIADGAPAPAPPPPVPLAAMGVPSVAPPAPGPARTIGDVQSQAARAADSLPRPRGFAQQACAGIPLRIEDRGRQRRGEARRRWWRPSRRGADASS
jgi:hypothetical protein